MKATTKPRKQKDIEKDGATASMVSAPDVEATPKGAITCFACDEKKSRGYIPCGAPARLGICEDCAPEIVKQFDEKIYTLASGSCYFCSGEGLEVMPLSMTAYDGICKKCAVVADNLLHPAKASIKKFTTEALFSEHELQVLQDTPVTAAERIKCSSKQQECKHCEQYGGRKKEVSMCGRCKIVRKALKVGKNSYFNIENKKTRVGYNGYIWYESNKMIKCSNPTEILLFHNESITYRLKFAYHKESSNWCYNDDWKVGESTKVFTEVGYAPNGSFQNDRSFVSLLRTALVESTDTVLWQCEKEKILPEFIHYLKTRICFVIELKAKGLNELIELLPSAMARTIPEYTIPTPEMQQLKSIAENTTVVDDLPVTVIYKPKDELPKIALVSGLMEICSKKPFKNEYKYNGFRFAITGSSSSGKKGYNYVEAYKFIPISEYTGELAPLDYWEHFHEVDEGKRPRCYVGMKATFKKEVVVFIEKVEFKPAANQQGNFRKSENLQSDENVSALLTKLTEKTKTQHTKPTTHKKQNKFINEKAGGPVEEIQAVAINKPTHEFINGLTTVIVWILQGEISKQWMYAFTVRDKSRKINVNTSRQGKFDSKENATIAAFDALYKHAKSYGVGNNGLSRAREYLTGPIYIKVTGLSEKLRRQIKAANNEAAKSITKEFESAEVTPIVKQVDGLQQIQMFDTGEEHPAVGKPDELFGYIAKDKIDRQRYKRKQTQLIEKLAALPSTERACLIQALIAKFTPPHK